MCDNIELPPFYNQILVNHRVDKRTSQTSSIDDQEKESKGTFRAMMEIFLSSKEEQKL
jgi:hypothetical protein